MPRNPPWLALCTIPTAALIVILPLILHGCSCGHDFDFHLISWMEAAAQFRAGTLHPAWAYSPAWNAGEPRFIFYPPLSWTLGGLLGTVLPWTTVPIAFTWLALVASGAGMYRLARGFAGERAATLAAALFIANPYMIFTAYERTAYGELLAAAWIPLLLAGILRKQPSVLGVALPVALLWLSNVPAAVLACYTLALVAALRLLWIWFGKRQPSLDVRWQSSASFAARAGAGTLLGLGLASLYLLPAAYERSWVQVDTSMTPFLQVQNGFLFRHTGDAAHDAVLHTVSSIAVLLLAATGIVLAATFILARTRRNTARGKNTALWQLAVLAGTIAFLLTPASSLIWRVLPEFTYVLFPWRFLAVLAAILSAGIALLLPAWKTRQSAACALALALTGAMVVAPVHLYRQACDDEDAVAPRLSVFLAESGTDPTDEDSPAGADNDQLAHTNPAYWLAAHGGEAAPVAEKAAQVPIRFTLTSPIPQALVLNLRDYPGWTVRVNGNLTNARVPRSDGLIAVPVPAGTLQVALAYDRTWDQRLGEAISAVCVLAVLAIAARARWRPRSRIIKP